MRRLAVAFGLISIVAALADWWRRHPRVGAGFVNRVVDPWLVREGAIDESHGELGLIEHIGRVSGIVRRTPVHPVPTEQGFRIVVPLGTRSEWVRNILAAGHTRLQLGQVVHELDEPALVLPSRVPEVSRRLVPLLEWLGFRYLLLHRYAQREGHLEPAAEPTPGSEPSPAPVAAA